MKRKGELIMGIGHRIKTVQNPDKRVELLKKFAGRELKKTPYLDFALAVESETLKKKNNLILNVDGAVAVIFLDILKQGRFSDEEVRTIIDAGALNGLFALSRSIGMIGHILDQKRMNEGLYRHPWDDILYL
ncbi:MAG: citrate synthase [candidate division WS6 bacterium OLB20]|uniref:citrate synthase (unknown stereospecificity) n=1 Tax=candidate division WS6 bacterium OLB20 TaxID=1617426 RepID=A0A136LW20_9BACT|nr:MAG: citrate synthase [candidate division WS6 bacterium OLB20]